MSVAEIPIGKEMQPERSYSFRDAANALYPPKSDPPAAAMEKWITYADEIFSGCNLPELTVSGTLPVVLTGSSQNRLTIQPVFAQKIRHEDAISRSAAKKDISANNLIADVLAGPQIDLMVDSATELGSLKEAIWKKLEGSYPMTNRTFSSPGFSRIESRLGYDISLVATSGTDAENAPYVQFSVQHVQAGFLPKRGRKYPDNLPVLRFMIRAKDNLPESERIFRSFTSRNDIRWQTGTGFFAGNDTCAQPLRKHGFEEPEDYSPLGATLAAVRLLEYSIQYENLMTATPDERMEDLYQQWITGQINPGVYSGPAIGSKDLYDFRRKFRSIKDNSGCYGNLLQTQLYQMAKTGIDVRETVDAIRQALVKAAELNPGRFWRYFRSLGLISLFPDLDMHPDKAREIELSLALSSEADGKLWARAEFGLGRINHIWRNDRFYQSAYMEMADIGRQRKKMAHNGKKPNDFFEWAEANFRTGHERLAHALSAAGVTASSDPWKQLDNVFRLFGNVYPDVEPPAPKPQWDPDDEYIMRALIGYSSKPPYGEEPFTCILLSDQKYQDLKYYLKELKAHPEKSHLLPLINQILGGNVHYDKKMANGNPNAHAESEAMRSVLAPGYGTNRGRPLRGYAMFTNSEPCEVCFQQAVANGVSKVVFAVPSEMGFTKPFQTDTGLFEQKLLTVKFSGISPFMLDTHYFNPPKITGGLLMDDAAAVFPEWDMFSRRKQWYRVNIIEPLLEKYDYPYDDWIFVPKVAARRDYW